MPPVPAAVGGPDYAISASASSGLPVTFAAAPASAGICTVSGSTVSFVGAGTCTVVASQAGNAVYDQADPVQQSFTVGPGAPTLSPQTISFTSTAPGGAVVGGPAYTVAASASSGLAVVFTVASASAGVCTVSGATVSLVGVGTCTINANQAGNASYLPALAGAAVVLGLDAAAGVADDQLHLERARLGGLRRLAVHGLGHCRLRSSGRLLRGAEQRRRLHRLGLDRLARRRRHVHRQREPGGQRLLPCGAAGAAVVRRRRARRRRSRSPRRRRSVERERLPLPRLGHRRLGPGGGVQHRVAELGESAGSRTSWVYFQSNGTCIVRANQAGNANYLPAPQVQQSIVVVGH